MPRLKAKPCARCQAKVPIHDWPADHRWPILCDTCLRTWPTIAASTTAQPAATLDTAG